MRRVEDFETFCAGDVWFHKGPEGAVKVSIHNEKAWLSPDEWAEVEQKIRTIDVEPGERLYLAAAEADGNAKPIPWRDKSEPSKVRWREAARTLGIGEGSR